MQLATDATGDASPADVPAESRTVAVQPGRGAYVLSGGWGETADGSPFVVDAKGQTYPLVGPEVAERLGYADYPPRRVPDSWVELFDKGVNLSVDAALCPPDHEAGQPCDVGARAPGAPGRGRARPRGAGAAGRPGPGRRRDECLSLAPARPRASTPT